MEEAAATPGTWPDPYQHKQLHEPTTHIRLLKLSPYKGDFNPLSAELISVALDKLPPYMALSYVWGPETPLVPISLHGKAFTVHQNLYAFLWHYLRLGRKDLLWTDALCINQNDAIEKALQVGQMGKIYGNAQAVVIWLGAPEPVVMDALNFLPTSMNDQTSIHALIDKHAYLFKNNNRRFNDAIMRFSQNPYWTRLWVVQEFTLARNLYVQYGFTWIEWEDFWTWMEGDGIRKAIEAMETNKTRPDDSRMPKRSEINRDVAQLVEQRGKRLTSPERRSDNSLMNLIAANYKKHCKDPRDRVYGLLALLNRERPGAEGITANYQIDALELFSRILEAQNPLIMSKCSNSCSMWTQLFEALELDQLAISQVLHQSVVVPGPYADSILSTSDAILIHAVPGGEHVDMSSCSTIPNNIGGGPWNICLFRNIDHSRGRGDGHLELAISPIALPDKHVLYRLHGFEAIGFLCSSSLEETDAEVKYQERTAKLLTFTEINRRMSEEFEDSLFSSFGPDVEPEISLQATLEAEVLQMIKTLLTGKFGQAIKDSGLLDIGEIKVVSHMASTGSTGSPDPRHREFVLEVDRHTFAIIIATTSHLRSVWRMWSSEWHTEVIPGRELIVRARLRKQQDSQAPLSPHSSPGHLRKS
jgi:hypothetical protein